MVHKSINAVIVRFNGISLSCISFYVNPFSFRSLFIFSADIRRTCLNLHLTIYPHFSNIAVCGITSTFCPTLCSLLVSKITYSFTSVSLPFAQAKYSRSSLIIGLERDRLILTTPFMTQQYTFFRGHVYLLASVLLQCCQYNWEFYHNLIKLRILLHQMVFLSD